jgi:hypothetical protein
MQRPPFVSPVRVGTATPGQAGVLVDGSLALLFDPSQVTVAYDPDVISTGDGASITGAVRVELAGGYQPPTTIGPVTYTDASAHTVATIAMPAGKMVVVEFTITGNLGTANGVGNINAPNAFGMWVTTALLARVGSGSVQVALVMALATASAPFCLAATTSSTGLVAVVGGATSAVIQVNGFSVTEAWTSGHTYTRGDSSTTPGQFVTNAGNVYVCTTSGTASGSAPSGTGTGLGTGALFDFVCAGSTVPVQWSGTYSVSLPG